MKTPSSTTSQAASPVPGTGPTVAHTPPPRAQRFARRTGGVLLAVLAGLGLLLGALSLAGGGGFSGRLLLLASLLYLGYFFWARGMLKMETKVLTGLAAVRDNERDGD
ncbi:hypothetical protein [Hymenobacter cheonanensis]|uniref:hypothetical protein n=1 Tax=Hymenobacter sp. CA2-7 TaxID=3063993 RepID=UPI002712AB01|nr:hypothetical protein [Hymenobacter sp. CA2-7]MDO7884081.1 hypothetical protein [Hymenobacter sp. CA2-7]